MSSKLVSYSSVLGIVVANKRKDLGIEQGEVAKKMGLSQASYSRLESGRSTFSVDQLFQCADALGIRVEDLIRLVVNMINKLNADEEVKVQAQPRGNATKAGVGRGTAFVAGAGLAALIIGLASKSK